MKINETTLQHVLKSYGKGVRPEKARPKSQKAQKEEHPGKDGDTELVKSEEVDVIKYDKEGKVSIDSQKKEALIDFFQ